MPGQIAMARLAITFNCVDFDKHNIAWDGLDVGLAHQNPGNASQVGALISVVASHKLAFVKLTLDFLG